MRYAPPPQLHPSMEQAAETARSQGLRLVPMRYAVAPALISEEDYGWVCQVSREVPWRGSGDPFNPTPYVCVQPHVFVPVAHLLVQTATGRFRVKSRNGQRWDLRQDNLDVTHLGVNHWTNKETRAFALGVTRDFDPNRPRVEWVEDFAFKQILST